MIRDKRRHTVYYYSGDLGSFDDELSLMELLSWRRSARLHTFAKAYVKRYLQDYLNYARKRAQELYGLENN